CFRGLFLSIFSSGEGPVLHRWLQLGLNPICDYRSAALIFSSHKKWYEIRWCRIILIRLSFHLSSVCSPPPNTFFPMTSNHGLRVLSIDGGGVRGHVPLRVLQNLKRRTGKEPHQLFDLVCGSGSGGILALLVGLLKVPV